MVTRDIEAILRLRENFKRLACADCDHNKESAWSVLDEEQTCALSQLKAGAQFKAGQTMFHEGTPCLGVYCIVKGTAAIRRSDAGGHTAFVRLAHAGDMLGHRSMFEGGSFGATAVALTDVQACLIPRNTLLRLIENNPALAQRFLKMLAEDLGRSEDAQLHVATLSVRGRLAWLLYRLRESCGEMGDDGVLRIELPLSRKEIAEMIGTRPETVARTVRALEEAGVARFHGRHVLVDDLDQLLDEIESPVEG